jgi:hypothetical protein
VTDEHPPDRREGPTDRRGGGGTAPGGVERRRGGPDRREARPTRDDLAGNGRSGLSASAALRARDVDRPGPDDLARAEAELTIVRRHWTPPPA